jgi:two-component system nitrogen regulation response regulator GlnG
MQEIYRILARLMQTDLTVMISGESGTGKELVARALHEYGRRRAGPFVAVNVAAIPRELVESELFGHEKGAFTGAQARGVGRFEQAEGGTLFLDEIGDMPLDAQTRLLRVLQEGEYTTVGGRQPIKTNVRIIAATNRDLRQLINQGQFREDLFYRLNVVPIRLPPLRERSEDIPDLVRHFLAQAEREGLPRKSLAPEALDMLRRHRWPGNVRELENLVRRLAALYTEDVISAQTVRNELAEPGLPADGPGGEGADSLSQTVERHLMRYFSTHGDDLPPPGLHDRVLREIERPLISLSLAATRGNQIRAAHLLGLNRNTLRKKIRELDIRVIRGLK